MLRLAAGLWADGALEAAHALLADARDAAPVASVYDAALGMVLEGRGDWLAARDRYLAYLDATAASDLHPLLARRIDVMRGRTAGPIVQRLLSRDLALSDELDPRFLVAVPRLIAQGSDPELALLAAAATELLVLDLRERDVVVLDWELAEAARRAFEDGRPAGSLATAVAGLLRADGVLLGSVERVAGDSLVFDLAVHLVDESGVASVQRDSVLTTLDSYSEARARLADRALEMVLEAPEGAIPEDYFPAPPAAPVASLLTMGEALLAADLGNEAMARDLLSRARSEAPEFTPFQDRISQWEAFELPASASTMPLADELLRFARLQSGAVYLMRQSDGGAPVSPGTTRHGIGEAFGLDRLGAQAFLEFVIAIGERTP